MTSKGHEFSFRTREQAIQNFREQVYDLLVIGGGITGAAVARDASSRGLKVALVERRDFAFGTSSRSSKLIHGGLRYLENFEFGLVFEALSERALLLKTAPHMVRPLPFYLPVFEGDRTGKGLLGIGLWLYDILALFRAPGFHKDLSKEKLLKEIPFLQAQGLKGGFMYYDASMWDDVLAVETLRAAYQNGADVANYIEAVEPIWGRGTSGSHEDQIVGFHVKNLDQGEGKSSKSNEWVIRAKKTVICAGPWTDQIGVKLSKTWNRWLTPSKGIHLIFDLKKIPLQGAIMMTNPADGRIAFVIPRPDFGPGVVIVGTTDGPTHDDPERAEVQKQEVDYLMGLLSRYFPSLGLSKTDILSAYVGVRPLMGPNTVQGEDKATVLQKVSREHHIADGPGGTVIVAGGKYTTHRKMGEEIVDFALKKWHQEARDGKRSDYPIFLRASNTSSPVNPLTQPAAIQACLKNAQDQGKVLPQELVNRYGAKALDILHLQKEQNGAMEDPEGFPALSAQLRNSIRSEMVIHLEDFYLRRLPLYASRKDHGLPWLEELARVWAEERGLGADSILSEIARVREEFARRSEWMQRD